ncbi:MAG: hypothetical protein QGI60_00690 [archaeon]|jgi:hypothetical protein|nr:hypothetical protein [archaeon]
MPAPKPKPGPKFKGKKLQGKINARMKRLDKSQKTATKLMGVGFGTTAAFDPHIGIPIAAVGVGFGLHEAVGRNALRRKLLKHPKAAALMAQRFKGTEYEAFFRDIANKAKPLKENKSAGWKIAQARKKDRTKKKRRPSVAPGKFRTPGRAQAELKGKK